ncbi:MAG: HAD-IA family hydrolase [Woeseiaceae bacterium]|nr:HAD-IA family hydrolase [Woeseiaceae bacterium]
MDSKLTDFPIMSFDCYGTLIDWETGIWDALQPLLMANHRDDIGRTEALAVFGRHESEQESENPSLRYTDILERVHRDIADAFHLHSDEEMDRAFGYSVPRWPAFADAAESLRILKRHFRLAILSNVDHDSFAASNQKLGVEFDAIYLAEDIGSYKPDPANFEYLLEHVEADFGAHADELLHTAQSLMHDHEQANEFGIANCWIDRQRLSESGDWGATKPIEEWPSTDFQFFSLAELARAVLDEVQE